MTKEISFYDLFMFGDIFLPECGIYIYIFFLILTKKVIICLVVKFRSKLYMGYCIFIIYHFV